MNEFFFDKKVITLTETTRAKVFQKISNSSFYCPNRELENELKKSFWLNENEIFRDCKFEVQLDYSQEKTNKSYSFNKSFVGATMVVLGQPILKKRFVTKGAAIGTSIASKYLSKVFPQRMPFKVLNTKVFGRALGRAVPYVGWALLAIDVIELLIEVDNNDEKQKGFFSGGTSGGGGTDSRW